MNVAYLICFFLPNTNLIIHLLLYITGERQANINIADGRKSSVILASEAAKMDQVNRALGW